MKKIAKMLNLNINNLSDDTVETCIIETIFKHMMNRINRIHKMNIEKDKSTSYAGLYTITIHIKIADSLFMYCHRVDINTLESEDRLHNYTKYVFKTMKNEFIEKYSILLNNEESDIISNYIKDNVTKLLKIGDKC